MSSSRDLNPPSELLACVLGDANENWLCDVRRVLPAGTEVRGVAVNAPLDVVRQLADEGWRGGVLLIEADCLLPPFWWPRLLSTLQQPAALAVAALTAARLPGVAPPADLAELVRLDALCHAHGSRQAFARSRIDAPVIAFAAEAMPLAADGVDVLQADGLPEPWRLLQKEDLLVAPAQGTRYVPRDEAWHLQLADRLREAMAADMPDPGYPGLDDKPVVLHVLHGWGGGAARWVRDLAHADPGRHHVLLGARASFDRQQHGEAWFVGDARADGPAWRQCTPSEVIADTALQHTGYRDFLASVVADYGVDSVLVSSLIGHSLDALRSGLPTTLMIHDHYPLWPLLYCNFGDPQQAFDEAQLRQDLANAPADFEFRHRQPAYWWRLRSAFIDAARSARAQLVAPSRSAMADQLRMAPELAELRQQVIPHGSAPWPDPVTVPSPPSRQRLRLLVPGRIRKGKGAALLRALLPEILEYAKLVLLGAGTGVEGREFFGCSGIHLVLDYDRDDLPKLLARLRPDAALIVPTVSETFSYTLSEMRSLGVPVLASDIGALAERIEDGVDGLLVRPDAAAIVEKIAELAADPAPLTAIRANLAVSRNDPDWLAMRAAYQTVLPQHAEAGFPRAGVAGIAQAAVRAANNRQRLLERQLASRDEQLAALATQLQERTEWAAKLQRAQRKAAADLSALQTDFDQRSAWALELDRELQALKPEYELIIRSRSWRLTRPLRDGADLARRARESLRFRVARARSLRGRLRGSLGRRGVLGTVKRIRQEFQGRQPTTQRFRAPDPNARFQPFSLPTSDTPEVSIIIPVYNNFAYTAACLQSLAEHAGTVPFEVIVVDDASSDRTAECLPQIDGVRALRNAENLGFIGSCNAGAERARGEYVLFLNNDTLVTAGWLEALRACFAERDDAGLVGARLMYADGRLQEAGGIVFADGSGWNYGRLEHPDDPRMGFRRTADYCSGAAIMLRRELFHGLGGFDERYKPAYYEDTDLAFQVRAAGLQVYVEPRALVVHFEGISNGTDTESETGTKRFQKINHAKFVDKWRDTLRDYPAPIADADQAHLAATWRATHRVLIVDASTPTPDQDSGSVRLVNIMRILRDMGCQVSFLPDNLARFDKYTPLLQVEGVEALYHPFVESLPAFYRQRGGEFDLIIVSRHYVLAHHLGLIRLHAPQARLAFDTVDLHYLRETRAAELDPRPELERQARETRRQELKLINESDVTLVVSRVEQTLLATDAPDARVEILSNVHDITGTETGFDARRDLLFIGGFQHPPNIDAMLWFVGEVLPRIHAELPEVSLHIVGSKIVPEVEALAAERVIVHGFVEDIEPMIEAARISIAPLRYGAGVKGKVNMAMSRGLPVVATPMAVEGIDAEPGHDVMVGEDAEAFADAVVRLYRDPALWAKLSRNGADNVRRQFSFDAARATLADLLR